VVDTANQDRDRYEQSDVHVKDLINDSIEAGNESFDRNIEEEGGLRRLQTWKVERNDMRKSKSTLRDEREQGNGYAWNTNTEGSDYGLHDHLDLEGDRSELEQHSIDYTRLEKYPMKKSSYHEESPQRSQLKKIKVAKRVETSGKLVAQSGSKDAKESRKAEASGLPGQERQESGPVCQALVTNEACFKKKRTSERAKAVDSEVRLRPLFLQESNKSMQEVTLPNYRPCTIERPQVSFRQAIKPPVPSKRPLTSFPEIHSQIYAQ
jgi:hypothetical protein